MTIENFTKVMDFVYLLGSKAEKVTAADSAGGKKIKLQEWTEFIPVAAALPGLIKALPEFIPELKDMDKAEKDQFVQHAKDTYDLKNDKAEMLVEKTIEIGLNLWMVAKELIPEKD